MQSLTGCKYIKCQRGCQGLLEGSHSWTCMNNSVMTVSMVAQRFCSGWTGYRSGFIIVEELTFQIKSLFNYSGGQVLSCRRLGIQSEAGAQEPLHSRTSANKFGRSTGQGLVERGPLPKLQREATAEHWKKQSAADIRANKSKDAGKSRNWSLQGHIVAL